MTAEVTGAVIDDVARELREVLTEEAADALATQIVGQLQSKYLVIPLPEATGETTARAQAAEVMPWLFPSRGNA